MNTLRLLLTEGKLAEALSLLTEQVRNKPADLAARGQLIELLCVDGQLERADQQLNLLVQQHPETLTGAWKLRLLIRAQQARLDFHAGSDSAELFNPAGDDVAALLALNLARRDGDSSCLSDAAATLEAQRSGASCQLNQRPVTQLRDIDDTLGAFVELFGTDGKFYLARVNELVELTLKPATSLVESIWRPVSVIIKNGPEGEAFLPLTYVDSSSDAEKLGRETDWQQLAPQVFRGRGLKTWLVDDEALPLAQIEALVAA